MPDTIHVLVTARFTKAHLDRLRRISPRLLLTQTIPSREMEDTSPLFTGDEEVYYGMRLPYKLTVAPKLKWVQLHSAGVDHLAGHPIWKSQIKVTTSSGVHATPIGEFAIALMLGLARKIPRLAYLRERSEWPKDRWEQLLGVELRGKTLGIIGYGSIGRETARIAKRGFGMRVIAMKRGTNKEDKGFREARVGDPQGRIPEQWFDRAHLLDLLRQSDFVLLAAPFTSETHLMIGETELRSMKPTAFLINIARGELIDEPVLVRALRDKWIAGAGLDAFAEEPLPRTSQLWHLDNVILSPHASSATPHYDDRAVELFAENLRRYLIGEPLLNLVNESSGY